MLRQFDNSKKVVERFGISDRRAVSNPIESQFNHGNLMHLPSSVTLYRQPAESLMYLAVCTSTNIVLLLVDFHSRWKILRSRSGLHWEVIFAILLEH